MTLALAETGADVTAVEIDQRPDSDPAVCGRACGCSRSARLTHSTLDWTELLASDAEGPQVRVGARAESSLQRGDPVVAKVLDECPEVKRLVVMVQREVGERLAAAAGEPAYGAVSVKVAYSRDCDGTRARVPAPCSCLARMSSR